MSAARLFFLIVAILSAGLVVGVLIPVRGASAGERVSTEGACGVTPVMYGLSAPYHHLPEAFVRELTEHEPGTPAFFEPQVRCGTYRNGDGSEVNYCMCFGSVACTHLKASERCGEIGLTRWKRAGVCRARSAARFDNPCIIEFVTIG